MCFSDFFNIIQFYFPTSQIKNSCNKYNCKIDFYLSLILHNNFNALVIYINCTYNDNMINLYKYLKFKLSSLIPSYVQNGLFKTVAPMTCKPIYSQSLGIPNRKKNWFILLICFFKCFFAPR